MCVAVRVTQREKKSSTLLSKHWQCLTTLSYLSLSEMRTSHHQTTAKSGFECCIVQTCSSSWTDAASGSPSCWRAIIVSSTIAKCYYYFIISQLKTTAIWRTFHGCSDYKYTTGVSVVSFAWPDDHKWRGPICACQEVCPEAAMPAELSTFFTSLFTFVNFPAVILTRDYCIFEYFLWQAFSKTSWNMCKTMTFYDDLQLFSFVHVPKCHT